MVITGIIINLTEATLKTSHTEGQILKDMLPNVAPSINVARGTVALPKNDVVVRIISGTNNFRFVRTNKTAKRLATNGGVARLLKVIFAPASEVTKNLPTLHKTGLKPSIKRKHNEANSSN